ncbi:DUF3631 domain-containing protein [Ruegeria arenilitoris]|uniref:DUF3631 domain-containing protein n=1 Tax=Ruegeria arenilitoris TaxID=1173585 RepID=UPI00147EFF79|nr:DUF3631 domain-containing protein [Ruegeria arenilitoris]
MTDATTSSVEEDDTPDLLEETPIWYEPVSGPDLAESIHDRLMRHILFQNDEEADAVTLWVMSSWLMDRWYLFPKLFITSPEPGCGKSTLAEVVEAFSRKPLYCSQVSQAALFRVIEMYQPTLLLDEADLTIKNNDDLVSLINAGHTKRHANVLRTQEVNNDHPPRVFSVWAPQVISGIGRQNAALESRCVKVELRRKLVNEKTERKPGNLFELHPEDRQKLARWAQDFPQEHIDHDILPMNLGSDRVQDNWQPLYKVAFSLGEEWLERAKAAYHTMESGHGINDLPIPLQLVWDIWLLFEEQKKENLPTSRIVDKLNADPDAPWCEINRGQPLTQHSMMGRLRKYKITTHPRNSVRVLLRSEVNELYLRYVEGRIEKEEKQPKGEQMEARLDPEEFPVASSKYDPNAWK